MTCKEQKGNQMSDNECDAKARAGHDGIYQKTFLRVARQAKLLNGTKAGSKDVEETPTRKGQLYMATQLHPPPAGAYGSSPLLTGPQTDGTRQSRVLLQ